MKVLNLYAGIGGNRKLWEDVEVTAVEYNEEIAAIYKDYFPNDKVIVADAHEYLLKHYKEFDFIWGSPPCQTHTKMNLVNEARGRSANYPDMKLWQEIIFLNQFCKGKFIIENVIPYYQPLISPSICLERHLFWSNFKIRPFKILESKIALVDAKMEQLKAYLGYDDFDHKIYINDNHDPRQILRNCVHPEIGLYLMKQAIGIMREENTSQIKMDFEWEK